VSADKILSGRPPRRFDFVAGKTISVNSAFGVGQNCDSTSIRLHLRPFDDVRRNILHAYSFFSSRPDGKGKVHILDIAPLCEKRSGLARVKGSHSFT